MNKVNLIGRLTNKPELKYVNGDIQTTKFTLAVNRAFKNSTGEREADFISCVAWRKTAELICSYLSKGSQVGISGRIQTGSFEGENGKVYTTDVIVEDISFIDSKKKEETTAETSVYNDPFADFGDEVRLEDDFLD